MTDHLTLLCVNALALWQPGSDVRSGITVAPCMPDSIACPTVLYISTVKGSGGAFGNI